MISSMIVRTGLNMRVSAVSSARKELAELPWVSFGQHSRHGERNSVVRFRSVKDGKTRWIEFLIDSKQGKKLVPYARRNALLREVIKECSQEIEYSSANISKENDRVNLDPAMKERGFLNFSYEEFCGLVEHNDQSISPGYKHGRYLFRSKSEMLIAQVLDQLGLEYKYEPVILINGEERWPDFAVYCPETGRYFFIEHLGMMDKMKYRLDNMEKMTLYEGAGIRNGIDILYTTEYGKGTFTTNAVMGKIAGIVIAQALV
ncbi:MAG TPA: hypothetical protein DEO39_01435 [Clostridiales bacterium]|nr:hypothetical protein [Clostridiales bacterium]